MVHLEEKTQIIEILQKQHDKFEEKADNEFDVGNMFFVDYYGRLMDECNSAITILEKAWQLK